MARVVFIITVIFLFISSLSFGGTIYVPSDAPTIQAGIDLAQYDDTVLVADGIYFGDGNTNIIFAKKSITLLSENGADNTTISGQEYRRAFIINNGLDNPIIIEGFTIRNCFHYRWGGAFLIDSSALSVNNCNFYNNESFPKDYPISGGEGGVFRCENSIINLSNSTFIENKANIGYFNTDFSLGGAGHFKNSELFIVGCNFSRNYAKFGQAINIDKSICSIVNSSFEDHVYTGWDTWFGGAVNSKLSDLIVDSCKFINNGCQFGGAIHIGHGSADISNSLFVNNEAGDWGGAIDCRGIISINHCTFSNNKAYDGSTIYIGKINEIYINNSTITNKQDLPLISFYDTGNITLTCTNIFSNSDGDWTGQIADQFGVNGNISVDPRFCDTAKGDFYLTDKSPCLPENNECGELIGALGLGCVEKQLRLKPDPCPIVLARAIEPESLNLYLGNLDDSYAITDIDLSSVTINNTIIPDSIEILPAFPKFYGEVIKLSIPAKSFIEPYGLVWDTTKYIYSISGQFTDNQPFNFEDTVSLVGHIRGDLNEDGILDINDIICFVGYLFKQESCTQFLEVADITQDNQINISDLTLLIQKIM